jgi:hypothetical protein
MNKRKTYKKKRKTYKRKTYKRKTYKKIYGGMFPRLIVDKAKGLALDTMQSKIERSKTYSETQKKLEETANNGINQLQGFLNDENKENINSINYERFSPVKSDNPLVVPKRVFQAPVPEHNTTKIKLNEFYESKLPVNPFPQPKFEL